MGIARIIVVSGRFGEKFAFSQCRALEGDAGSNVPIRRMAWPDEGRVAGSTPSLMCLGTPVRAAYVAIFDWLSHAVYGPDCSLCKAYPVFKRT